MRKKSINIPTKVDLNKVVSSSNLEAANQVLYIPTKMKIRSQYIYSASIGTKNSGSIKIWNQPVLILRRKKT
jgi:hypothetical protein